MLSIELGNIQTAGYPEISRQIFEPKESENYLNTRRHFSTVNKLKELLFRVTPELPKYNNKLQIELLLYNNQNTIIQSLMIRLAIKRAVVHENDTLSSLQ